jgi:CheY-like chemotaxis protein
MREEAVSGRGAATVVVVDDDEATLGMISTFLRRNGFRVIGATNPVRALDIVRAERVDLLITDWMMPHVDGITLTEQVHELPGQRDLPVIMMTAHDTDGVARESLRRGVALTLAKPLELTRLLDLVGFATASPPPASSPPH